MNCHCDSNTETAKATQKIADVKDNFEKSTTHNPAEIDQYEQQIHEAKNGQEAALRKIRDDIRSLKSSEEAWVNAGKGLDRLERDCRSIKFGMLKAQKDFNHERV